MEYILTKPHQLDSKIGVSKFMNVINHDTYSYLIIPLKRIRFLWLYKEI